MYNYPIPYISQPINYQLLFDELNKLKHELDQLKDRIKKIEDNQTNNYLKKDDNYYMI